MLNIKKKIFKKGIEYKKICANITLVSDYMYAMAAIPLAVHPVQKIRFIPYAHARWNRFLEAYKTRFG
jgi:hypothetical protein